MSEARRIDRSKPILVVGSSGFIGSNLVEAMLQARLSVRGFDRFRPAHDIPDANYAFVQGDFLNRDDLTHAMEGCDVVYHLVSMTVPAESNKNPVFDARHNVAGSVNLFDIAVAVGIKRVVFISSGGTVYGITGDAPLPETHPTEPISAYGIGKLAIEKYLALYHYLHGLDYRILRVANPYGNNQKFNCKQGIIPAFVSKLEQGEPLEIWGDGSVVRDYVHIDDVTGALLTVLDDDKKHKLYNIGSGFGHSINDIIALFEQSLGHKVKANFTPGRKDDVPCNILDITRAKQELGWQPTLTLEQGIARLLAGKPF